MQKLKCGHRDQTRHGEDGGGTRERGGAENITRRNKQRQAEVFWERGRKEEGFRWRQNKNVEKRKAGRSADAERSLGKTTTVHCKR